VSDGVRAFFAVDLPADVRAEAGRVRDAMQQVVPSQARWIDDSNLHLTLKFLGEIPSDAIPKLLSRAAGRMAATEPFHVTLAGTGAFPSPRAARVLWIGVGEGLSQLAKIARKLDAAGRGVGAPRERRPYRAHLTVARLREPTAVPVELFSPPEPSGFSVEEVVLYESRLSSSGATYLPLARLPLGADDAEASDFAPEL
jgi:2'-5' RNA ligase